MSDKILCPVDQTEMHEVGDHGIVDYDGNWDAQATKYECSAEKKHTIFVVDSNDVLDPYEEVFDAVEDAVIAALQKAEWYPNSSVPTVRIREQVLTAAKYGTVYTAHSLEDLRNDLARIAIKAFREAIEDPTINISQDNIIEYEYVHAIGDVDEILAEEFHTKLKEMRWVDQPKDYAKKQ